MVNLGFLGPKINLGHLSNPMMHHSIPLFSFSIVGAYVAIAEASVYSCGGSCIVLSQSISFSVDKSCLTNLFITFKQVYLSLLPTLHSRNRSQNMGKSSKVVSEYL